jgi:hypothetical protein
MKLASLAAVATLTALAPLAEAAPCRYPIEYFRPSLGICEPKAGGLHYRAPRMRKPAPDRIERVTTKPKTKPIRKTRRTGRKQVPDLKSPIQIIAPEPEPLPPQPIPSKEPQSAAPTFEQRWQQIK